jgi:hypothetical protein
MADLVMKYVFIGFFVVLGVMLLVVGVRQHFQQRQLTANPQRVKVTITKSEVKVSKSSDTDSRTLRDNSTTSYRPELNFMYQVDGKTYESDMLRPTDIGTGYASHDGAAEVLKPYPLGATVDAWVSPTRPEKAFLLNEPSSGPLVFMIVGAVIPVCVLLLSRWL